MRSLGWPYSSGTAVPVGGRDQDSHRHTRTPGSDSKFHVSAFPAVGCPGIWVSIILNVSVRVFLDQINTEFSRAEQTALADVLGPVQSTEGPNKTEEPRERALRRLPGGPRAETPCFPASGTQMEAWALPGCQAPSVGTESLPPALLAVLKLQVSSPPTVDLLADQPPQQCGQSSLWQINVLCVYVCVCG